MKVRTSGEFVSIVVSQAPIGQQPSFIEPLRLPTPIHGAGLPDLSSEFIADATQLRIWALVISINTVGIIALPWGSPSCLHGASSRDVFSKSTIDIN
jgi:hypothetical protein